MAWGVPPFSRLSRYVFPTAAVVVVLAMTLVLTAFLREREQTVIRHLTASLARAVRADIEGDLEVRVLSPIRHAELWELPPSVSEGAWQQKAGAFLEAHRIFRAVGWAANEAARRSLPEGSPLLSDIALGDLLRRLAAPSNRERHGVREPVFLPARQRSDGARLRRVVVPIFRGADFLGAGVAEFSEREGLDAMLEDVRGRGYAIAIEEDGRPAYGERWTGQTAAQAWVEDAEIRIAGIAWRVRVWPTAELLGELQSSLPHIVLVLGVALACFVGLTSQFHVRLHERAVEVACANELLRDLSGRLFRLHDEERRGLARELSDGTAQMLVAVGMSLGFARRVASPTEAKLQGAIEEGLKLVRQSATEVQALAYRLHPLLLEDLGLAAALPPYAEEFERQSGIRVSVRISPDVDRLDRALELAIFRIAQEALMNVLRHSGSTTAQISLQRCGSDLALHVCDQGRGIPTDVLRRIQSGLSVPGVGIAEMRERVGQRGGSFEIHSGVQGTTLVATLPISESRG